jgi:hypothetical protein
MKAVTVGVTALGALTLGLGPAASASTPQVATGVCSPSIALTVAPWEQTCEFFVPSGIGTLELDIVSGSGTATVTCAPFGSATITASRPGTYALNYQREGLCELVAEGNGQGSAGAS